MKQPPPATEPIVLECDLPQPPALVWRALTERDLLAAWLLPNNLRAEVGARFTFEQTDRQRDDCIDCEVLEVEPERTLRWRQTEAGDAGSGWQAVTSVVTIELTDNTGGGTHLRLVHDGFARAAATVIPFRRRATALHGGVSSILTGPDIVCQLRRAA
jgi:uncharacterized protein YndB with AHSA1/START domain